MIPKMILFSLAVVSIIGMAATKHNIWDENITPDRLNHRVKAFNDWYNQINDNSRNGGVKVQAQKQADNRIGLVARENLNFDDVYLKLDKKHMIGADLIYDTNIGPLIKQIEHAYGYDDYTNMVFYLLHEMNKTDSTWKPYLDVLPRQPESIAFKYWDKKNWIEQELLHTPILSNIFLKLLKFRKNC
jgi:hypothetical protein